MSAPGTTPITPDTAPFAWKRRRTREVRVGDVGVGGDNPIRVQSMTTPETADVEATFAQLARLARAGCEIVRVTVPTSRDAEALPRIRARMKEEGIRVPLVADIHFSPAAAMRAVEHVEKIRINPGNYADRKKFAVFEISDDEYAAELERIEAIFRPLVLRAKELGVAMRIGTNHGSLSDRIMNRYGDTPLGMVESALEFVRICEAHDYHDLVLSMKSSNPQVMIQAYRLLADRMTAEGMAYPFHLGVTEAGDGEDGRIKSAIGIGGLLEEGIGDTVRVSLTEDPVEEVPVAFRLVAKFNRWISGLAPAPRIAPLRTPVTERRDPFAHARRTSREVVFGPVTIGGAARLAVEVPLGGDPCGAGRAEAVRSDIDAAAGPRVPEESRAEFVELTASDDTGIEECRRLRLAMELVAPAVALSLRYDAARNKGGGAGGLASDSTRTALARAAHRITLMLPPPTAARAGSAQAARQAVTTDVATLAREIAAAGGGLLLVGRSPGGASDRIFEGDDTPGDDRPRPGDPAAADDVEEAVDLTVAAVAAASGAGLDRLAAALDLGTFPSPVGAMRLLAGRLDAEGHDIPIVLYEDAPGRGEDVMLGSASVTGSLLCDGIGDSLRVAAATPFDSRRIALGILQGARARISRTEFISCPSCGRTQFDLETTTRRIKEKTAHLKGLKIAIMGCIVNGPGEMADADFGYVGWGRDKISLFVGRDLVVRDIPTAQADERLIELIRAHGRWVDPPGEEACAASRPVGEASSGKPTDGGARATGKDGREGSGDAAAGSAD